MEQKYKTKDEYLEAIAKKWRGKNDVGITPEGDLTDYIHPNFFTMLTVDDFGTVNDENFIAMVRDCGFGEELWQEYLDLINHHKDDADV